MIYVTGGKELTVVSTAEAATLENVRLEVVGYSSLTMDVPDLTITGIYKSVRLALFAALVAPASGVVPPCLPPLCRKRNLSNRITTLSGTPEAALHRHGRLSTAAPPQRRSKSTEDLPMRGRLRCSTLALGSVWRNWHLTNVLIFWYR